MAYKDLINRFSATRVGGAIARTISARIDPWIYRKTGGRFVSVGRPTIPQLVLTTTGRKTGQPRSVQLGYVPDGDGWLLVGSNFGQAKHPAWSHNLIAQPEVTIELDGETIPVTARLLSPAEKAAVWPRLVETVPQYAVYVTRTDRDIRVFRLSRR